MIKLIVGVLTSATSPPNPFGQRLFRKVISVGKCHKPKYLLIPQVRGNAAICRPKFIQFRLVLY
jgi:hypothetical protein